MTLDTIFSSAKEPERVSNGGLTDSTMPFPTAKWSEKKRRMGTKSLAVKGVLCIRDKLTPGAIFSFRQTRMNLPPPPCPSPPPDGVEKRRQRIQSSGSKEVLCRHDELTPDAIFSPVRRVEKNRFRRSAITLKLMGCFGVTRKRPNVCFSTCQRS